MIVPVFVRALLSPRSVVAGKLKVFWQQEAPLLHPLCLAHWLSEVIEDLLNQSNKDLCGCSGGSCTLIMKHFCKPWAAFAVLFFTSALRYSCLAGICLVLYSIYILCLSPSFLSIPNYIAHGQ